MAKLSIPELYDVVRRNGAQEGADRVAVAAALAESGGNDIAHGDFEPNYGFHSWGLWQMHDQGLGAGMSRDARCDPDQAAAVMVPVFNQHYSEALQQGLTGEEAARYTCMWTERPAGFPDTHSPAADNYAARWQEATPPEEPPMPTTLTYDVNTSPERQVQDWTCSVRSTCWALRSLGVDVTAAEIQDEMVAAGLVSPRNGLEDGSGAALAAWLRDRWGLPVEQSRYPAWEDISQRAGRGPILLGSTRWYHWCDVRAPDGDALWLNNPAPLYPPPGYQQGIGDHMDTDAWAAIQPDAAIWIPVEPVQEDELSQEEKDELAYLRAWRGLVQGDYAAKLRDEVAKARAATLKKDRNAHLDQIDNVVSTLERGD